MFDGSHRTNKREINLAGASASSRASRKTHLNVARQQRLARAQAKAKLNGAKCLQKSWRGSRGRRGAAAGLDEEFQAAARDILSNRASGGTVTAADQQMMSRAASLLAFRMSPALLPFFASRYSAEWAAMPAGGKKWRADDVVAERQMRQDLLTLERILRELSSQEAARVVSPIAGKRIVSITLILLRQSTLSKSKHKLNSDVGTVQGENAYLVRLLDCLLESLLSHEGSSTGLLERDSCDMWTSRPSDYYMDILRNQCVASSPLGAHWMINIFLCFRDIMSHHEFEEGGATAMDVDGCVNEEKCDKLELQQLMKWCCRVILHLWKPKEENQPQTQPLVYQQALALLASIVFSSCHLGGGSPSWITEQLIECLASLDRLISGNSADIASSLSVAWAPTLIHFIATSITVLPNFPGSKNKGNGRGRRIPGIKSEFSSCATSDDNSMSNGSSTAASNMWMEALGDTLHSKEISVMNQVLLHSDSSQAQTKLTQQLLACSIPTILQYTLQQEPCLAMLTRCAAQGDNITSLLGGDTANAGQTTGSASLATAAAVAAFEGEDDEIEDESDDDEKQMQSQENQPDASHNATTFSTGRHSRADLLTLPKLDSLYQTGVLRAKKAAVDRLQHLHQSQVQNTHLLVSLAEKIGKGEWIQQLGDTLFDPLTSLSPTPMSSWNFLAPLTLPLWQRQAQTSYMSALSAVMTNCSGIKAGRNAASPLLARLAFHDQLLSGLWERTLHDMRLLTSQSTAASESLPAYEVFSAFCDTFAHHLLAVNDDDFLERYHQLSSNVLSQNLPGRKNLDAKDIVVVLRKILNDLYWVRPVLASDVTIAHNDAESRFRFERARLLLSGTKLWNSLYERWCRLYRAVQFCDESSWWFPHLASKGQHDNNPIIQSQTTTMGDQGVMDDGSVGSSSDDEMDDAAPVSSGDAGGDALASTFRDPKMARVLTYIPQAMPFSRRVNLFNALLESDKLRSQDESMSFTQMMRNIEDDEEPELSGRERVTIRRDSLYLDSKRRLNVLGKRLRKRIQVTFVNKLGQQEAGIDGGGVFKEFLDDLIKDAFLPEATREESSNDEDSAPSIHPDFFSVTPLQTLKVNTMLDGNSAILSHYEFLGRVLGKAIYESILVEPQFCLPFLNKVLGKQNSLDDLKNLDPEYYKNLKSLRHMSAKEINGLGLTFELHDSTGTTIELMPGGSSIPVTRENVIQYIHLVSHQKMNVRGSHQTAAFLRGFRDIIPAQWVRLFSAYELQKLISGDDAVKGIDVKGMMSVMRYSGGFHPSQSIVQWLWEVVDAMTPDQQRKFLRFMTSCSRQPLLGFSSMTPAPCIQQIRLREDHQGNDVAEGLGTGNIRLPTSSTCMNLLKLPKYTSKEMLREKLLYAIESASGFELS